MPPAKSKVWSKDWFAGLAFFAFFLLFAYGLAPDAFYSLETVAYDRAMQISRAQPNDRIAIIAIDEKSIANIGRWPWSRDVLSSLIDQLETGDPKLIASTVLLSENQIDPGLDAINQIKNYYESTGLSQSGEPRIRELGSMIDQAASDIDFDARLANSIRRAGNVILPMEFMLGEARGNPDQPLPAYIASNALDVLDSDMQQYPVTPARTLTPPVAEVAEPAVAIGHLNVNLDADGKLRFEPLVVQYFDQYFASLALTIAAFSMNVEQNDISVLPGTGVEIGGLEILTRPDLSMLNYFYNTRGGQEPFSVDSFYDVWTGLVPVDKFRNKIVLIGASATGLGDYQATPVSASTPPIQVLAHTVSSILQEHFVSVPDWVILAQLGTLLLLGLYVALLLPVLKAGFAAFVSVSLVLILIAVEFSMFLSEQKWVPLMIPAAFVLGGHLVMTIKRFQVTERLKLRADVEGAESNKMLGLAFQGQGQLDMAFEKFRRCPLDESMMELLYNLSLDYERKRQFNKAGAVYSHMADFDIDYRDLKERLRRSQRLEETMILGGAGGSGRNPMMLEGGEKPMLGRYQVEKEIGKGAMGVVYLGRDPKINRVVAIKAIPLSEEFEASEVASVKERFFREAETAGRLNHPDIVTVYDAGEDHDLAYIAMEYLTGEHLNRNVEPDNLLEPATVMRLISRAADALAYAHRQGIIHRDIKPANIMFDPEKGDLKITDFGIARMTDTKATKTGIILGTPSYMAPEQLEGKNVTGRSDLFALGVTLYQLLTGRLPFEADSMTALMYKIANEDPPPLKSHRDDLPECVEAIITRALRKDPDDRYQVGSEMAVDLNTCCESLA